MDARETSTAGEREHALAAQRLPRARRVTPAAAPRRSAPGKEGHEKRERILARHVREVLRELPGVRRGEAEAIHRLRVAGRRLRLVLPVLARKPSGRRVARVRALLHELMRAAGESRDLDASAELLAQHPRDARVELRALHGRLRAARKRSGAHLSSALRALPIARLERDLGRLLERGAARRSAVEQRLARLRATEASAVERALRELQGGFDARALHRLRIRVRRLRYTAELGQALLGRGAEAALRLKGLQEALGAIHDGCVLAGWLEREVASATRRGEPALAGAGRSSARRTRVELRGRHRSLLASHPGALVHEALRVMDAAEARGERATLTPAPRAPRIPRRSGSAPARRGSGPR